jgi:thioesterase domain-containing protein
VNELATLGATLESTWRTGIPLAEAMRIEVAGAALDADGTLELAARAPLAANMNVHGTAFAGSLFSLCVLTGWGAVWLALERGGARGSIVVADARIRYRKAVAAGPIECRCRLTAADSAALLTALASGGRGALTLACTIAPADKPAVAFEADYVVHAAR